MKAGRPRIADREHKVLIHRMRGYCYASTKYSKPNKDGKMVEFHKHWGTVENGNVFKPGNAYFYADVKEREKLVFPADWDLSAIKSLEGNRDPGRIAYEGDDVDRQYGPTWFLNQIAEKTGLLSDLKKVFGGNMQKVNDILTLAYFRFIDNLSYNQLKQWQREVKAPSERELSSKEICYLTQSITEQNRMDLLRCRSKRTGKSELCAIDSTSISTYGFNLADIRWGKNKEKLPLRQTLEVIVYSLTSRMPIYYKELPGNMPDCRTLELILKELENANFKNLVLITDRGYESLKNIEIFIAKRQKIITSVKISGKDVMEKIRAIDMTNGFPANMELAENENLYYAQYDMAHDIIGNSGKVVNSIKYKLNLYFDPIKHTDAICNIKHAVQEQSRLVNEIIKSGKPVLDKSDINRRFNLLCISYTNDNKISAFVVNDAKVSRRVMTAGFFASKTLGFNCTPLEAKDNYGMRDAQEKTFALQKGPIGEDRIHAWSESSKHGRTFICFVALILASYMRSVYEKNKWLRDKFDSIESVLAEMRTIRCIEHRGHTKFITPFVGNQVQICSVFGFDIPEGCSPKYVSKQAQPRKRGRPPKAKVETQKI